MEDYYYKEKKFEVPKREVSIIASDEGFYPPRISVFAGEKVHFFITSTTTRPSCFMMPKKEVFLSARKGEVSETNVYFAKTGTYTFYCPTGKIKGDITVLERPDDKKRRLRRELASEKVVKIWRPRDE